MYTYKRGTWRHIRRDTYPPWYQGGIYERIYPTSGPSGRHIREVIPLPQNPSGRHIREVITHLGTPLGGIREVFTPTRVPLMVRNREIYTRQGASQGEKRDIYPPGCLSG